jgi:hypothetical protein
MGIVIGAELILYQKGNFKNENGIIKSFGNENNILIKDVVVGMGCDLSNLEDNTL